MFKAHEKDVTDAIRNKGNVDLSLLESNLRNAVAIELADTLAGEMRRQSASIGIEYDPAAINIAANEWAKRYSYDLVRGITERTREIVSNAVTKFTEAQGMTIGDLKDLLEPAFGQVRADAIGVTETTRAYAQSQKIYKEDLKRQGVEMERVFHTLRDGVVCPICRSLNGVVESDNGMFWSEEFQEYYDLPVHVGDRCSSGLRVKRD